MMSVKRKFKKILHLCDRITILDEKLYKIMSKLILRKYLKVFIILFF